MSQEIKIQHPIEVHLSLNECSLNEKLTLCEALDLYEVDRKTETKLVVDVVEISDTEIIVKITLKEPLTYKEIYRYLKDILEFTKVKLNKDINLNVKKLVFSIKKFGLPSISTSAFESFFDHLTESKRVCISCGKIVHLDSKFCNFCGRKIAT
jgi:hypothetical protein